MAVNQSTGVRGIGRDLGCSAEPAATCAFRWARESGAEGVARLADAWNGLAHGGSLSPTADAIWTGCLWRAFASSNERLAVRALYSGPELVAVLPLRGAGRSLRRWETFRSAHAPYWMFALREMTPDAQRRAGAAILDELLRDACCIDLRYLHANGPLAQALKDGAAARGLRTLIEDAGGDSLFDLGGSWDEVVARMGPNVAKNAPRKRRQLEKLGRLSFDAHCDVGAVDAALPECMDLEAAGWKGLEGTPMKSRPDTLRFYTELARQSAAVGRFALYTLRLGGRVIAFEYCIRAQRKIDMLKISFDPDSARYSPGNVLRYLIFEREHALRTCDTYHMGRPSEWKLRWATRVEPLIRLRVFARGLAGGAARLAGRLRGFAGRAQFASIGTQF